ncbi:glycosyltransferase [Micromonospora sp. WMMD812]|uniref:glycosyltransferase family 2 protein n=1 Tax=Micromonospora sp. WMMD812 TaxID=3015152 RepID=UPI00248C0385|nr:glycosyltransferase [Micromonospora sp. WMMD812]WBB69023.1 glycosyltransferase [Micromonospora sp. WMMD812]
MTFDIMLPYYGSVALMQAAVRSVMAQTDPDWRLTVVDDGTEPGVPEWFAGITDERVRYQRNERNLGVTGNYRKCVGLAEHEYLVMMGTDDIMHPNYLATVRSVIDEYPGVCMIQPGVEVIDADGVVVNTMVDEAKRRLYAPKVDGRRLMGGEELAASLLRGCWFYFPSICWRTDALKAVDFRDEYQVIQDLALVIDLIRRGEQMAVDTTVCFQYRRHAVSKSAADAVNGSRFTEARAYFLEAAELMEAQEWPRAARAARRYTSSRLHAITLLPTALRSGRMAGVASLSRHAFGPASDSR